MVVEIGDGVGDGETVISAAYALVSECSVDRALGGLGESQGILYFQTVVQRTLSTNMMGHKSGSHPLSN